jgi:NAD(P)-dependent dehydrogenase (short-subunit alcohol dehydrogenase family)
MELGLQGNVAIVTGGSKGIGRATALAMIEHGVSVLICARGEDGLEKTAEDARPIAREPARIETVSADLNRPEDVRRVVARCIEVFGRVDFLINNAGSARRGAFLELTDQAWFDDFNLKFFGYVRMAREVFPHMQRRKRGVIINVIGVGGMLPAADYMIGGSANAALYNFTRALAEEGAKHGIRAVGVNPGPILTERLAWLMKLDASPGPGGSTSEEALRSVKGMNLLKRAGSPQEVANLVLFLCSDRAAFIDGATITIDGGRNPGLLG